MAADISISGDASLLSAMLTGANLDQQIATIRNQLSTGQRINQASDDAAGLAISNRMESSIRAADQVTRGMNDGLSMIQVAEGGVQSITDMTQRMRTLAVQGANGIMSPADRLTLSKEFEQLKQGINDIANKTEIFGQRPLANQGSDAQQAYVTTGANRSADQMAIQYTPSDTQSLGINDLSINTAADAEDAIAGLDAALDSLNGYRSQYGANYNSIASAIDNAKTTKINTAAAKSSITDTDYATMTAELAQKQFQEQANNQAMKIQAGIGPKAALSLLTN